MVKAARIRLLDNPKQIQATVLNISFHVAQGKWIIQLDIHSEYPPDYLQPCMEMVQRIGVDNRRYCNRTISLEYSLKLACVDVCHMKVFV